MRYQERERAVMISELVYVDQWNALVEELMGVYRQGLIDGMISENDPEKVREAQIRIRQVPELLHYLKEVANKVDTQLQPRPLPKKGY